MIRNIYGIDFYVAPPGLMLIWIILPRVETRGYISYSLSGKIYKEIL